MLSLEEIQAKLSARFQNQKISSLTSIPRPFKLANVKEACQEIAKAIQEQKRILVVGDYDADGILSTALVVSFFRLLGLQNFSFTIPNRFTDGYGLSVGILERFQEAELILTVDNGITAIEAAEYCKAKGKTLIITDHHSPKDKLPEALIVNPKLSGFFQEEICGAMVAWYLCAGLKLTLGCSINLTPFLEFAGIATVSDVMPLQEINRVVLKKALKLFKKPHFPFSQLLLREYKNIDEECIAFYIAPLLNASGRLAQAEIALDFLLSSNPQEAQEHYQKLQALNLKRKAIQEEIAAKLQENLLIGSHCVIAYGQDWHEGVLGILASKLAEQQQCCAFVLTLKNGLYCGSGRSFGSINLFKSLQPLEGLIEFGGHAGAVGIKIPPNHLEEFAQAFKPSFEENLKEENYLGTLSPDLLTPSLLALLDVFAPYGEGNPRPSFTLPPIPILSRKVIGKAKNHMMFTLDAHSRPIKAFAFFSQDHELDFERLRFHISRDSFSSLPTLILQR